jgi:hypothetical protein
MEIILGAFIGMVATFTSMWIANVEMVFKEKK